MKRITVADTLELSLAERIQLVEDIWDTITPEADAIELTPEEKKLIDDRLERYRKNPDSGSLWDDVYKRIISKT